MISKLEAKNVLPNMNHTQAAERAEKSCFCPWWPWHSNLSEQGTKHVFSVNLVQICSTVPEIFHTETKKSQRQKQNLAQFTECSNNTNIAWIISILLAMPTAGKLRRGREPPILGDVDKMTLTKADVHAKRHLDSPLVWSQFMCNMTHQINQMQQCIQLW